jgi:hypothetical protein
MRIGHYIPGLQHPGGVSSYVRRVSEAQRFCTALPGAEFFIESPHKLPLSVIGDLP